VSLYLVTGGAGFIGSSLARALVSRGDRVRIIDNLSSGKRENLADIAERVELVVPHIDPTLDKYDVIHVVQGEVLVDILPVRARGASQ